MIPIKTASQLWKLWGEKRGYNVKDVEFRPTSGVYCDVFLIVAEAHEDLGRRE